VVSSIRLRSGSNFARPYICRLIIFTVDGALHPSGAVGQCQAVRDDVQTLREDIADVLAPLGLRLSPAKTQIVHISEALDFLGFHIQRRRKRGTSKWYVYTFIAERPIRSVKQKIRALTRRTSQQPPRDVLIPLNQIMRGWANNFRHAVCKHTFGSLENIVWHRVIFWWMRLRRNDWNVQIELNCELNEGRLVPVEQAVERRPPTPHRPKRPVDQTDGGRDRTVQHRIGAGHPIPIPGQQDPQTLDSAQPRLNGRHRGEPFAGNGTAGSASGLGKRTRSNPATAPQADSTTGPTVGLCECRHQCTSWAGVSASRTSRAERTVDRVGSRGARGHGVSLIGARVGTTIVEGPEYGAFNRVETKRIELSTPALQRQCSAN
jgi:hypothetical protein